MNERNTTPEQYVEQINWFLVKMKEDPQWRRMLETMLACANRVYVSRGATPPID